MREIRANDYWKKVNQRKYNNSFIGINLNNLSGIPSFTMNGGIFAICGLNGAGKTTVISAIKDLLGIEMTKQDLVKINGSTIAAKMMRDGTQINLTNTNGCRFCDFDPQSCLSYIDYHKSTEIIEFFLKESNLDELVEQNEENEYDIKIVSLLGYIIGKEYDSCSITEIEEIEGIGTIPYFRVSSNGIKYDSKSMGIGEHFIFYMFWILNKLQKNSIVLIEEPETFISIASQDKLMNFIASIVSEKQINVIITTHSPFILKNIKNENIRVISRYKSKVCVNVPTTDNSVFNMLGIEFPQIGTLLVEDEVAKLFLELLIYDSNNSILRDFSIISVSGKGNITKYLQLPPLQNYKLIGVYDGDIETEINSISSQINGTYCFLPNKQAIELEFKQSLQERLPNFLRKVERSNEDIVPILSKLDGEDYHDWLLDFCKEIGLNENLMVKNLFSVWKVGKSHKIKDFIETLSEKCYEL